MEARLWVGGEQGEAPTRERGYGAKVALVEGEEPAGAMPVREDNDREVGKSEVEAGVAIVKGEGDGVLIFCEGFDSEPPLGQVLQKGARRLHTNSPAQQVVHLSRHWSRNDELARLVLDDSSYRVETSVAGIGQGDEGCSVDDEGQLPNPSRSSSSGMSPADRPSPAPEAVRANRLSGWRLTS